MIRNYNDKDIPNLMFNARTGEVLSPKRVYCVCGHTMNFLSNRSAICTYCGRTVYPSKECEFREKLEKERRKKCVKYQRKR